MKGILFVFLCVLFTSSQQKPDGKELAEELEAFKDTCIVESGVDPANANDVKSGTPITDPKQKCYVKCIYKRAGKINDNGELQKHPMNNPQWVAKFNELMTKCNPVPSTDPCDKAYNVIMCLKDGLRQ